MVNLSQTHLLFKNCKKVSEYTLALLKEANLKELCDDIPALSIKLSNLSSEARTIINKIYAKAVLNSGLPINAPAGILVLLTQLLEGSHSVNKINNNVIYIYKCS